ncbi:hypothetical protein PAXRUDRAFT_141882 [Paxillus rubicundulus Ve08.2h10]|uniref:Unplaced genomic scaffold scaffold_254, whole genome shotgun sequence n=1 Tax=Paxillus rubicundulus Ve08.2h10 TaxID=930991 RepID=A0A0D0DCI9_9AGAM|nr:hypothetical protein PAXRUDRAFT_141882 [Paxillus rubicundulus Ve08.2h10]
MNPLATRQPQLWLCLLQYTGLLLSIILVAVADIIQLTIWKEPRPYHTSIPTGQGWVMELLICYELRMHVEVFSQLISELHDQGCCNSLESQCPLRIHLELVQTVSYTMSCQSTLLLQSLLWLNSAFLLIHIKSAFPLKRYKVPSWC